tara:strand:+ start:156 stop:437 length:282 start_codon:yes stop_codon:yes gene_type:complete
VENEKTWDKDFSWFDQEHYDCHEVIAGSRAAILAAFHELILTKWPNNKFGTTLRNIRQEKNEWYADVSRFKTETLCKKHCKFPSTFKRTGVLL